MSKNKTPELEALEKAVELAGGQTALAEKLGEPVKQQHIYGWLTRGNKRAPAEFVIPIETAIGGQVTRYQLRPDIYPVQE